MSLRLGAKPAEEPEEIVNETMLIEELKNETAGKIVSIFNSILNYETYELPDDSAFIDSSLEQIKEDTKQTLFGALTSLANKVDNGFKIKRSLQEELHNSSIDLGNATHARSTPTPFILRFFKKLKNEFRELDTNISNVQSSLLSLDGNNSLDSLGATLLQEHRAILRCSSKVSNLRRKYEETRKHMLDKLNLDENKLEEKFEFTSQDDMSYAENIKLLYNQYISDKNAKLQKWIEDIDLFGETTATVVPAQSFALNKLNAGAIKPSVATPTSNRVRSSAPPPSGATAH
ncbi:hypothetical protein TVAG_154850 [Trichomonas vaginalis G3]|uniref:Uncharacterized protein n=1 Tax=Trichomonas vaginalis (strain ATCC PRA-98 / G3) TaxID=412133 RepID=A2F276_TRIV3|nr:hypothetical protein TVAGG3_0163660 [Trichomonas vaginalis G3]EAY01015.1 hypothetical protein TVAG_154850 [Trichomonas vaginalis G3]KAI5548050.1 hypothetical protein TVAGG3_0163660 [Trichomonas vaginalis G3]|eukprot:XP_001330072.1 hypothetical protein [Trichomonas vaginalis G3]